MFKQLYIKDYGYLSIEDTGKTILDKNGKKLAQYLTGNTKYYRIRITINNKRVRFLVHRLVALAFLENPNNYKVVNHIDGNKLNNNVSNLEWCTYQHNMRHAYDNELIHGHDGETNGQAKLTEEEVLAIRDLYSAGYTPKELAEQFDISLGTIYDIVKERTWTYLLKNNDDICKV